jgi:ureidoacrylate peracid hydrolase
MEISVRAVPEAITLDTEKTALIVVDMQNAFCKPGGMMDYFGNFNEEVTNRVISVCQRVVAIARENAIPVIYLRMSYGLEVDANLGPESPFYWKEKGLEAIRRNPELAGRFLMPGTWDVEIIDELKPEPGDTIIDKSRFSGFVRTRLDATLQAAGIKYILFTGLYSNVCVESTLRDAFFHEYFPILISDGCGNMGPDFLQKATEWNVQSVFGWVTTSENLIKSLK